MTKASYQLQPKISLKANISAYQTIPLAYNRYSLYN